LTDADVILCRDSVARVSHSFAFMIGCLPLAIRDNIRIFYLMMQSMDVVEDDPDLDTATRASWLRAIPSLWATADRTDIESAKRIGVRPRKDSLLIDRLDVTCRAFRRLDENSRAVILPACADVARAMLAFVENGDRTPTLAHYQEYCELVGGATGMGLTHLFARNGVEGEGFDSPARLEQVRNLAMFVQKVDLIEDFAEDAREGRRFVPQEFMVGSGISMESIRLMALDAMTHIESSCAYIDALKQRGTWTFVAGIVIGCILKLRNVVRDLEAVLAAKPEMHSLTKASALGLVALAPRRFAARWLRSTCAAVTEKLKTASPPPVWSLDADAR
jgi:farnesyl-diphosphate farnesyltransferase